MARPGFRFEATWAGIRFDVTSSRISHGRKVVSHTFPKRDGADTEDLGREEWRADLEFIFIDRKPQPGEDVPLGDFITRFLDFDIKVATGGVQTLIHPYSGAVRCRVENFSHDADGDGQAVINASATFVEDIQQPPVFAPDGAGVQTLGGAQDVRSDATSASDALADEGLVSAGALDQATEAATRWEQDPSLTAREVQTEMALAINALNEELNTLGALTSIDRYPIHRDYTLLQWSLRRTAEAFTATTTRIVQIDVTEPLPLRVIAARFYGATEADDRFSEMLELNQSLKTPLLVPAGTQLKAYSPNVAPGTLRPAL